MRRLAALANTVAFLCLCLLVPILLTAAAEYPGSRAAARLWDAGIQLGCFGLACRVVSELCFRRSRRPNLPAPKEPPCE